MDIRKLSRFFSRKEQTIKNLLEKGKQEETNHNLDGAYENYLQAAELGSGEAMAAIGALYAAKEFRMVEQSNLDELILQGMPIFPWSVVNQTVPDMKTALSWYCKAAELEHPQGCAAAGTMLCEGIGCQPDPEKGLGYLNKALALGVEEVRPVISIFDSAKDIGISDIEYEKKLQEFVQAVESGKPEQYELYSYLKGGTERQLTRLGCALITRRNLMDPKYDVFKYLISPEGIPYLPCCARRGNWSTFVRVDLNAFPSDDILLLFSSDIRHLFVNSGRLKPAGSAVYHSPAFGWLGEEKSALVFKIDRQHTPQPEAMQQIVAEYNLQPKEYAEENAAFLVENGEKEYSVEIAAVIGEKLQILYRYTIGGSDAITSSFEPELVKWIPDQNAFSFFAL